MEKSTELKVMHRVWDELVTDQRRPTSMPGVDFNEIVSSVFATGPFYFYIIDFFDMSISNISVGFKEAHGIEPSVTHNINHILALVHPDDMEHVAKCEKKAFELIYQTLGVEKITRYKISYNFRFKTADGTYKMYNHQSLILTVDEKGNFIKSLNIHTDISHLTRVNNFKFSLIGIAGEPTYMNLDPNDGDSIKPSYDAQNIFTIREIEIIKLIALGCENNDIAEKLFITVNTVKTHRKTILRKAGCGNSAELIAKSMSEGWV